MFATTVGEKPVKQWLGIYKGIVVNNADPLGQQRVQAQVPQVLGTAMTTWASPLLPIGVAGPPAGTYIAVVFLGGDPDKPVYLNQTASAVDWTLPNLVVGDPVVQQGTFTVYGANGTYPASNLAGGLEVDNVSVTDLLAAENMQVINQIVATQPGTTTAETWHTMFGIPGGIGSNGWTIFAGGYHAMFRLNADGNVELSGRVYSQTGASSTLCQLPTGYYQATSPVLTVPLAVTNLAGISVGSTIQSTPRISLSNTGSITLSGFTVTSNATPGSATIISLDGVMFPISAG